MAENENLCMGVNVFGYGNIISDETFCTQSQTYGGKVPEFSAETLSAFVKGWQLVAVGVT